MSLIGVYNRFDPSDRYERLLFRAAKGLQSAELNELQSGLLHRMGGIADALFKDGDIVRDCGVVVDPVSGAVTLEAGAIYLRGAVREVASASFTIPVDSQIAIGLRYAETTVTELEDPDLRDPATGTRNYGEPGAGRLQVSVSWSWDGDGGTGAFHPVYSVDHGVVVARQEPPALDAVIAAIARYDREANGNYVTDGLRVRFLSRNADTLVFGVAEGTANINGFKLTRPTSQRLVHVQDPDLASISAEPHVFNDGGSGTFRIDVNRPPIAVVKDVQVTAEKSVTVTHGAFSGASDTLPDATIVSLEEVRQGVTVYAPGTDYLLNGDEIDWSPGGAEPAPGSSYDVTYRHITSVAPTGLDDTGFDVTGAVTGSTAFVDYDWKMPRVDILTIGRVGTIQRVKGLPQIRDPSTPLGPNNQTVLASIVHDWMSDPVVRNIAVRAVPVAELEDMRDRIDDLYDLVALERLRTDASIREPAAKKGLFVDNFLDDDLRDQGAVQTGAIFDGVLTLPVTPAVLSPPDHAGETLLLDYTLEPVVEQTQHTGSMRVNPYMAFDPLPAKVTLDPAVDQWTTTNTAWSSPVTRVFAFGSGNRSRSSTRTVQELLSRAEQDARFLRSRTIGFSVAGFEPNEELAELLFDGIDLTPA